MSLSLDGRTTESLHLAGILGSGMSAIAQMLVWQGCRVSGSDRMLDDPDCSRVRERLAGLGCLLGPQDGRGVVPGVDTVVVSSAIEQDNPDIAAAARLGIPVVHRSDVLSALCALYRTAAVAGTSGKSTVTALAFELLRRCGRSPSLVAGANIASLVQEGLIGNACRGRGDILVIEADESDGTLVKYRPALSVFLNVSKDHKPVEETVALFKVLASRSLRVIVNADDPNLSSLPRSHTFGLSAGADTHPDAVESLAPAVRCTIGGEPFLLPQIGRHNLQNLLAAVALCREMGCTAPELAAAAACYQGLSRRFEVVGRVNGITVVDDYAHNPEKIRAAMEAAHAVGQRLFAVFQPHGFGPLRFMKDELIEAFAAAAADIDEVYILPVYYAGGTARRDISAADVARPLAGRGLAALDPADRSACLAAIVPKLRRGDVVLVMGARDPSLSGLARQFADAAGKGEGDK